MSKITRRTEPASDVRQRSITPDGFGNPSSAGAGGDQLHRSASPKPLSAQEASTRPPVTMTQIVAVLSDVDKLSSKVGTTKLLL